MSTFLSAEWRNLLMANYAADPQLLKNYLPYRTELDDYNGTHYVSLVGFLFQNTKVRGISFPFHSTFQEVNLRFYVRFKEKNEWRRGVVFIKELVPKKMITFVANTIYNENYATHRMKHSWKNIGDELAVEYYWKVSGQWNYIKGICEKESAEVTKNSVEEFITEHYWGYTFINNACTGVYEVIHPKWRVHKVKSYEIKCDAGKLYGDAFTETLEQTPDTVFLAEGSTIVVKKGSKISGQ